jgi:uncharacterized protein YndB with AHSA1/START domain
MARRPADPAPARPATPAPPISDAAVRRRTGRGWADWYALLDAEGASDRSHAEIAASLEREHGVDAWSAQAITVGYERAHLGRAAGQRPDGFQVSASRTLAAPAAAAFHAFADEGRRAAWLPEGRMRLRTAQEPKTARFDWDDGATRVAVTIAPKGEARCAVTITHERLPDAAEAERMKAHWRARLDDLRAAVEGGG